MSTFWVIIITINLPVGIELEPSNQGLWSALKACEEAYTNEKKQRFATAAIERAHEEERLRRQDDALSMAKQAAIKKSEEDLLASFLTEVNEVKLSVPVPDQQTNGIDKNSKLFETKDDDDLMDFFAAVSSTSSTAEALPQIQLNDPESMKISRDETLLTEKYVNQELGSGKEQVERLTASNYKWKNLNPYYVLQLDIDATEEDIRYRYKKLSTKVHPDKLRDMEMAREAFEEVCDWLAFPMFPLSWFYLLCRLKLHIRS